MCRITSMYLRAMEMMMLVEHTVDREVQSVNGICSKNIFCSLLLRVRQIGAVGGVSSAEWPPAR